MSRKDWLTMIKNYLKQIGGRIKELRKQQGLTQEDLADKAGLNPNYLGRIERGEINVTIETLSKIAVSLSKSLALLLPAELPTTKKGEDPRQRLKKFLGSKSQEKLSLFADIISAIENHMK